MNPKQHRFIQLILSILDWRDPGEDRLKVTHRKDGRFQVSWQYQKRKHEAPFTVSDERGFEYFSYEELRQILIIMQKIFNKEGIFNGESCDTVAGTNGSWEDDDGQGISSDLFEQSGK